MKLITGKAGEGKTKRIIELASELSGNGIEVTILTFEDSINSLMRRIDKYMTQRNIKENRISMKSFDYVTQEELIDSVKNAKGDIVFIDGLINKFISNFEGSTLDMYNLVSSIDTQKGIIMSAQRSQRQNIVGINIIEFGGNK
jgi:predicted ATP-dependent serine protease